MQLLRSSDRIDCPRSYRTVNQTDHWITSPHHYSVIGCIQLILTLYHLESQNVFLHGEVAQLHPALVVRNKNTLNTPLCRVFFFKIETSIPQQILNTVKMVGYLFYLAGSTSDLHDGHA